MLLCLALLIASGCNFVSQATIPTFVATEFIQPPSASAVFEQKPAVNTEDSAHLISVTPHPSESPTLTATLLPSPSLELPEVAATSSPTIQPSTLTTNQPPMEIPFAAIQIINPGPTSRLVSPFSLKALVRVEPKGKVLIELLGEDGRLLLREVRNSGVERRQQISLGVDIDYEIAAVAEAGRLQISVVDEFNRLVSVASTDLILLSLGRADVNPSGDLLENIIIQAPREKGLIQGGTIRVSGLARLRTSQPMLIELETTDGKIVGTRQVSPTPVPGSTYGAFAIDVPYQVSAPTKARLKIWEPSDRIPGVVYLSSVEVLLGP